MSSTTLRKDLTDRRFGRLVAKRYVRRTGKPNRWECICDCGSTALVIGSSLTTGNTSSCGCLHREQLSTRVFKHGGKRHEEYEVWCGMIKRCENPRTAKYPDYGGRGIRVCARWRDDFAKFLSDMGPRPSTKHSIDRVNNDGNYEPANCRWATAKEQANNRRPRRRS